MDDICIVCKTETTKDWTEVINLEDTSTTSRVHYQCFYCQECFATVNPYNAAAVSKRLLCDHHRKNIIDNHPALHNGRRVHQSELNKIGRFQFHQQSLKIGTKLPQTLSTQSGNSHDYSYDQFDQRFQTNSLTNNENKVETSILEKPNDFYREQSTSSTGAFENQPYLMEHVQLGEQYFWPAQSAQFNGLAADGYNYPQGPDHRMTLPEFHQETNVFSRQDCSNYHPVAEYPENNPHAMKFHGAFVDQGGAPYYHYQMTNYGNYFETSESFQTAPEVLHSSGMGRCQQGIMYNYSQDGNLDSFDQSNKAPVINAPQITQESINIHNSYAIKETPHCYFQQNLQMASRMIAKEESDQVYNNYTAKGSSQSLDQESGSHFHLNETNQQSYASCRKTAADAIEKCQGVLQSFEEFIGKELNQEDSYQNSQSSNQFGGKEVEFIMPQITLKSVQTHCMFTKSGGIVGYSHQQPQLKNQENMNTTHNFSAQTDQDSLQYEVVNQSAQQNFSPQSDGLNRGPVMSDITHAFQNHKEVKSKPTDEKCSSQIINRVQNKCRDRGNNPKHQNSKTTKVKDMKSSLRGITVDLRAKVQSKATTKTKFQFSGPKVNTFLAKNSRKLKQISKNTVAEMQEETILPQTNNFRANNSKTSLDEQNGTLPRKKPITTVDFSQLCREGVNRIFDDLFIKSDLMANFPSMNMLLSKADSLMEKEQVQKHKFEMVERRFNSTESRIDSRKLVIKKIPKKPLGKNKQKKLDLTQPHVKTSSKTVKSRIN